MAVREKIVLSWSGGKDSSLALHEIRQSGRYEVVALLTSVADEYDRISHHGVRSELLELQARAVDLPLDKIYLPVRPAQPCTNAVYEDIMREAMLRYRDQGVHQVAFGDIFLEDLRAYREQNLAKVDMTGHFPLWKRETAALARRFIELGFRAYISCAESKLGETFAGRAIDQSLLDDLPADVDPCGEYGEYHSFVYAGPIFRHPLEVEVGEVVCRETRWYADLLPSGGASEQSGGSPEVKIPPI